MLKIFFTYKTSHALFVFLCISSYCEAQIISHNNNIWLHGVSKIAFNSKWSFTFEACKRYTEFGKVNQQWFIRPSIDYTTKKNYIVSLGYSYYQTQSYGNPAMFFMEIPEHHGWLQIAHTYSSGKWKIQNRLRNENRFVGVAERRIDSSGNINDKIVSYSYRNRLRYMFILSRPIIDFKNDKSLSVLLGNEIFLNIGKISGKSIMNQNRIIAGLGFSFNSKSQIQIAYIHQNIWNYSNTILENNPTIRISFLNTIKLPIKSKNRQSLNEKFYNLYASANQNKLEF